MLQRLNREIALWENLNFTAPNILPFFGISNNLGCFPASVSLYLENGKALCRAATPTDTRYTQELF
jgi:hypothetical protein